MMKKIRISLLMILTAFLLLGCANKAMEDGEEVIYYLNKEGTAIVPVKCNAVGSSTEEKLSWLLEKLTKAPDSVDYQRVLPENVKLLDYTLSGKQLTLDFSTEYANIDRITEVLARAAIVHTLTQFEEISYLNFMIAGEALCDSQGMPVGLMNQNTFLDHMGSEENATKIERLTLYFANKNGDRLKSYSSIMEYNANVAVEKFVVEQLIAGPQEEDLYPTIPKDTKVMNITKKDDVCYVNLDTGFTAQGYDVLGTVTIYSIVNSLTELPGINSVQILINGETNINYKDNISLETTFQKNVEIVEKEK